MLKFSHPNHIFGILHINLKIAKSSILPKGPKWLLWSIMTIFIWAIHYSLRYLYTKYQWYNLILRHLNPFLQFVSFWTKYTVGYSEILHKGTLMQKFLKSSQKCPTKITFMPFLRGRDSILASDFQVFFFRVSQRNFHKSLHVFVRKNTWIWEKNDNFNTLTT